MTKEETNTSKQSSKSDAELLELGKRLQAFYDSGYVTKRQSLLFSFLKGVAGGVGTFLGGTIVIALLLWVLSFFQHVPILTHFINTLQHSLNRQ